MATEHARASAALDQIDVTSVEALTGIKREQDGVNELVRKATERKDKVSPTVYAKVMTDYQSRLQGLEDRARPLREQARGTLAQLVTLHAELKGAWEGAQLAQQEIEFRHELGELQKEDFESRVKEAKAQVAEREKTFTRAEALRKRFEEVLPAQEPAAPPAKPAAPPAEMSRGETVMVARDSAVKPKARRDEPTEEFGTVTVSRPKLVEQKEGGAGRIYMLGPVTSIGRTPDNQIAIDVREVSRRHAVIEVRDDAFVIMDMDSGNGTFVNDKRVKEQKLQPGDRIRIGSVSFVYELS